MCLCLMGDDLQSLPCAFWHRYGESFKSQVSAKHDLWICNKIFGALRKTLSCKWQTANTLTVNSFILVLLRHKFTCEHQIFSLRKQNRRICIYLCIAFCCCGRLKKNFTPSTTLVMDEIQFPHIWFKWCKRMRWNENHRLIFLFAS